MTTSTPIASAASIHTIEVDATVRDARARMEETGATWLAVLDHGALAGTIGREEIADGLATGLSLDARLGDVVTAGHGCVRWLDAA